MPQLLELLARELERPREVPAQVEKHLAASHGVSRDEVGAFLNSELPRLEDYEIDLILSPMFTPTLEDQAIFAEVLNTDSVPAGQWPGLVDRLVARPTIAHLKTGDEAVLALPLRAVSIERYVHRLGLDGRLPGHLFQLISHLVPEEDRPLLKAVARRAIWRTETREKILVRHLETSTARDTYDLGDVLELLRLVESYQPDGLEDLLARIPQWRQVFLHEVTLALNPKPFFNDKVQEMHGGGRDQRPQDHAAVTAKEVVIARLDRIQNTLNG